MQTPEQQTYPQTREGLQANITDYLQKNHIHASGLNLLVQAFAKVDRKTFMPASLSMLTRYGTSAYRNAVICIEQRKSSMSQPTIVAEMLAKSGIAEKVVQKKEGRRNMPPLQVLEIGTASGYSAAVTASIDPQISLYTVEIDPTLVSHATDKLASYPNVHVYQAVPGTLGVPTQQGETEKKYDVIISTVGFKVLPNDLLQKLTTNGTLVIPVGNRLVVVTRKGNDFCIETDEKDEIFFVQVQGISKTTSDSNEANS